MVDQVDQLLGYARERLACLKEISEKSAVGVKFSDKLFWLFSRRGIYWRVAKQCAKAIQAIDEFRLVDAKEIVFSIKGDYEAHADLAYNSSGRQVYPCEMRLLDDILLKT